MPALSQTSSSVNFPFTFSLKTDPDFYEIKAFTPGLIEKFFVKDSIFSHFPYSEIQIHDEASVFTEDLFFTEFLNMNVKFADKDQIYKLNHNFYLSEYQMNNPQAKEIVTGLGQFYMLSDFKKQDFVKNRSYYGNINSIVRQIMLKYKFPNKLPEIDISATSNFDVWYQSNEYDYEFIRKLSKYALCPVTKDSPIFTFINSKGEFVFKSVKQMMNQPPTEYLYYGTEKFPQGVGKGKDEITSVNKDIRNDVINHYTIQFLGVPNSLSDYNSDYYRILPTGTYKKENISLKEKLLGNRIGMNVQSIRKQYLLKKRSIQQFGIMDQENQLQTYKGWVNNNYIDSVTFPYRMQVSTNFNPKICSGKVVQLKFKSLYQEKDNKALEYNGNWLVLESTHGFDKSGEAGTSMVLGKSSLNIFKKHKFYKDFI